MSAVTIEKFVLLSIGKHRKTYPVYPNGVSGLTKKTVSFERRVPPNQRTVYTEATRAWYATSSPELIKALYESEAYGSVFVHSDDLEGKRKKTPLEIREDKGIVGARGFLDSMDVKYPADSTLEDLKKLIVANIPGQEPSTPRGEQPEQIPVEKVNVEAEIEKKKQEALQNYTKLIGDPPEDMRTKTYFYDWMNDECARVRSEFPALRKKYKEVVGKDVSNQYKNNPQYMNTQIKALSKLEEVVASVPGVKEDDI